MDFIKIAICDDEKNIRAYLASLVRKQGMERQPVIIFVTEYEKYVYDAFDVGAFQYLLKPIDEQRFAEVFGRAAAQILFEEEQKRKTLVIQYGSESRAVPIQDIYYIESRNHKVVLYLKDGELEYYEKIGRLEEELQGQFFRIHRGYLVNLAYVEGDDKTEVTLTSGISLPLSKRYEDFAAAYLQFVQ